MMVAEIFSSLQGEGKHQGLPTTFVRCAGCNLSCSWCDTPYARAGGRLLPVDAVLEEVRQKQISHLCLTGGEPLLQEVEALELVQCLAREGYSIEIETNGTIDFTPFQSFAEICMDVKCPSSNENSNLSLLSRLTVRDSVKFVVADQTDCLYALGVLGWYAPQGERFFSPVWGSDPRPIARFLLDHRLAARLQLQLHKWIGVR